MWPHCVDNEQELSGPRAIQLHQIVFPTLNKLATMHAKAFCYLPPGENLWSLNRLMHPDQNCAQLWTAHLLKSKSVYSGLIGSKPTQQFSSPSRIKFFLFDIAGQDSLNQLSVNQQNPQVSDATETLMPGHAISSPTQWRYTSTPATPQPTRSSFSTPNQ